MLEIASVAGHGGSHALASTEGKEEDREFKEGLGYKLKQCSKNRQAGRHTHWGFLLFPPYLQYWDYINQQEDLHQMWLPDLGLELLNHPSLLQQDCILSESIHVVQDFTRFSLQLNP